MVNIRALCERYAELGNAMDGQRIKVMSNNEGLGSTDFGKYRLLNSFAERLTCTKAMFHEWYLECIPCLQLIARQEWDAINMASIPRLEPKNRIDGR